MALMLQTLMVLCLLVAKSSQVLQDIFNAQNGFSQAEVNALFLAVKLNIPPEERAKFVRLGFHDCIGFMTGPMPWGRCDGCIDPTYQHNRGLRRSFELVKNLYAGGIVDPDRLNRADFLHFAASVAVCLATDKNRAYKCPLFRKGHPAAFKIGRELRNEPCPRTEEVNFPLGAHGWQKVQAFYNHNFDLTDEEIVIIQAGGHSLGKCRPRVSGYDGPWKGNPNKISTDYAQATLDAAGLGRGQPWKQVDVGTESEPRPQWQKEGSTEEDDEAFINLNSDVSMVKELQENEDGFSACGGADKDLSQCPDNTATLDIVKSVAAGGDNDLKNKFYMAWNKMTSTVHHQFLPGK